MLKREAKSIEIKVWRYLRDRPSIFRIINLSPKLYALIENLRSKSALCEYHYEKAKELGTHNCFGCPLYFNGGCFYYNIWYDATSDSDRNRAAARILGLIENW